MTTKRITLLASIASVYTVLSLLIAPMSFGQIQVRLGEALMILCLFRKDYIYALTLGCFLTNLIGVMTAVDPMILDILIGTSATFIAGVLVYRFRHILWAGKPVFPLLWVAVINGILVGLELWFYLRVDLLITMIYVALGEIVSVAIGLFFYEPVRKALIELDEEIEL